jgi:integrase
MVTSKVLVVTMALTDIQIRNTKPQAKQYKLSAGLGLYLIIAPNGGKWWRVRYRFGGKQKELSVGTYPDVSLKQAILKRDEIRTMVADDLDPAIERKVKKLHKHNFSDNSFQSIGREWFGKHSPSWSVSQNTRTNNRLEKDVYPFLGQRHINEVKAPELLMVLRRVEERGAIETAHRIRRLCSQIFKYAIATGRAERDPAADLIGAIPPAQKKHYSAITEPKKIAQLIRDINDYWGTFVVKCALKFSPLVFQRPGEIRQAEWIDIDLDNAEWRIPDHKMKQKGRNVHIVPLSNQAVEVLKEIQQVTGDGKYVFPSNHMKSRPMSENTVNQAIRRLGYSKEDMTAHGFRAMASTMLNEQGWSSDAIERQLAHVEGNEVRRAYNHAKHLDERKKMMQSWADYLDGLASGADVIPINRTEII